MLGGVGSEPEPPSGRRQEIDTRLSAVRARLRKLRERDWEGDKTGTTSPGERLEAANRYAAEAQAAAAQVLISSVEAFRKAAAAHERVARVHERAAAAGIGDIGQHERQAALHWAAAGADRQRAERAQSLLSEPGGAGPTPGTDEPREGVAP